MGMGLGAALGVAFGATFEDEWEELDRSIVEVIYYRRSKPYPQL